MTQDENSCQDSDDGRSSLIYSFFLDVAFVDKIGPCEPSKHCLYFQVCLWMNGYSWGIQTYQTVRSLNWWLVWILLTKKTKRERDATDSREKVSWNEHKVRRVSTTHSPSKTYKGWKRHKLLELLQLPKYSQEMEVKIHLGGRPTDSPDEVWVQLSLQEKGDNLHFGDRWDGARSNRNKK